MPPPTLVRHLDALEPLLDEIAATSGGRFTRNDYLGMLYAGRLVLWGAFRGDTLLTVMLVDPLAYPGGRTALIIGLAGQDFVDNAALLFRPFRAWAAAHGVRWIEIPSARPGWARVLKHEGLAPTGVFLALDLDPPTAAQAAAE